jgi:hypothetical protein
MSPAAIPTSSQLLRSRPSKTSTICRRSKNQPTKARKLPIRSCRARNPRKAGRRKGNPQAQSPTPLALLTPPARSSRIPLIRTPRKRDNPPRNCLNDFILLFIRTFGKPRATKKFDGKLLPPFYRELGNANSMNKNSECIDMRLKMANHILVNIKKKRK